MVALRCSVANGRLLYFVATWKARGRSNNSSQPRNLGLPVKVLAEAAHRRSRSRIADTFPFCFRCVPIFGTEREFVRATECRRMARLQCLHSNLTCWRDIRCPGYDVLRHSSRVYLRARDPARSVRGESERETRLTETVSLLVR